MTFIKMKKKKTENLNIAISIKVTEFIIKISTTKKIDKKNFTGESYQTLRKKNKTHCICFQNTKGRNTDKLIFWGY